MKKILLIVLIPALIVLVSCGGGSDGESFASQMKELKKVAENAQEMEKEMAEDPEASEMMFSDSFIEAMELNVTERKISEDEWTKSIAVIDAFLALDSAELINMDNEKASTFFIEHGYESLDAGVADIQKIADEAGFIQDVAISIMQLQQTRLIDGKETYIEESKELGQKINERGYSADDLRALETNMEYTGKAIGVLLVMKNYQAIVE